MFLIRRKLAIHIPLVFQKIITRSYVPLFTPSLPTPHVAQLQFPAPDFEGMAVVGNDFKEIHLSDYKGKYLVLFFYPLNFTYRVPKEVTDFNDRFDEFKSLSADIVGVSVDSHFSHLAWVKLDPEKGGAGKLKYPLLSDLTKNISKSYGVLHKQQGIAFRSNFIIDPKGYLRRYTMSDIPIQGSAEECLSLIKTYQKQTDEEVGKLGTLSLQCMELRRSGKSEDILSPEIMPGDWNCLHQQERKTGK